MFILCNTQTKRCESIVCLLFYGVATGDSIATKKRYKHVSNGNGNYVHKHLDSDKPANYPNTIYDSFSSL